MAHGFRPSSWPNGTTARLTRASQRGTTRVERGHRVHGHRSGVAGTGSPVAPGRRGWRAEHHRETGYPQGKVVRMGALRSGGSMVRRAVATVGGFIPRRRGSSSGRR
jgi:hypothetical protein